MKCQSLASRFLRPKLICHSVRSMAMSPSMMVGSEVQLRAFQSQYEIDAETNAKLERLAKGVLAGNRRDIAQSITKVESTSPRHFKEGQILLSHILKLSTDAPPKKTFRVGITGPPGAGKSTFVNELGSKLCELKPQNADDKAFIPETGHRVAVLPIDPSSFLTGGSILGDQTRMLDLCRHPNAYVRPSPNRQTLGGVTDSTPEVIAICEAGGYDIVFVETVGVGQAEIEVANCVDMFVLTLTPTCGDDLQGLKRGIMEMADLVIVNKAEGDLYRSARHIKADYERSMSLSHSRRKNWSSKVVLCSCHDDSKHGVLKVWKEIHQFRKTMEEMGELERSRQLQNKDAMWKYIWRNVRARIGEMKPNFAPIESDVMRGEKSTREACEQVMQTLFPNPINGVQK